MTERRQVPPWRKVAFYLGYLSMAAGGFLILSPFLAGLGDLTPSRIRSLVLGALAGVGLAGLGFFLRRVAIRGLAGSLVTLNPPKAREDLEPWSRAAGGLVDAALSEVGTAKEIAERLGPKETIKVRCLRCKALSEEKAKYCSNCGGEL